MNRAYVTCWALFICITLSGYGTGALAQDSQGVEAELKRLREQNRVLQEQVDTQKHALDQLEKRLGDLERRQQAQPETGGAGGGAPASSTPTPTGAEPGGRDGVPSSGVLTRSVSGDKLIFSGEGGIAYFRQDSEGMFKHNDLRVDEAKLFMDAKIWGDVYGFAELNLIQREDSDEKFALGELYIDFEGVSKLWGSDRMLNLRAGRIDIPFGEEYLVRDAIDNPLISHSLSDMWGVDEGVEVYGSLGKFQYVLAVQNGSHPILRDYDSDKAIVGRLSYDPRKWLHLSGSAMRTGALDVQRDKMSELWFGNGFLRALGPTNTTTSFRGDVLEGDLRVQWKTGHVKGAGGWLLEGDNDTVTRNGRDAYYYYVESVQQIIGGLYGVGRWSHIMAPGGMPLVGAGEFGRRFFGNLTDELTRLSLGLGYRWSRDLVFKVEYTLNRGSELGGRARDKEDLFGAEIGFRF